MSTSPHKPGSVALGLAAPCAGHEASPAAPDGVRTRARIRHRALAATAFLCTTIVTVFQLRLAAAGAVSQDVPVPGGTDALARSLGVAPTPEPARFVAELARLTHPVAEGKNTTRARAAETFRRGSRAGADDTSELVPIPLTVEVWSQAVFRHSIAPEDIVATILSDARAAHLCYGLSALDDETLGFFVDHPALIRRLYERGAASFAAFGSNLHVRGGHLVPPGGPPAAPIWAAVVGAGVQDPEAFITALFARHEERVAYLYDTIAELDAPHAAFALGLWLKDPSARIARFEALHTVNRSAFPQWQPMKLPFSRPVNDISTLLARVEVDADGVPSAPAHRSMWSWILESDVVPADASGQPGREGEVFDAAWLAQAMLTGDAVNRGRRLDQLAFGQRLFHGDVDRSAADALLSIRAFPRQPMLMLAIERMGIRDPSVFAAAARRAQQIGSLDGHRAIVALRQFQGALALIARLAAVRVVDESVAATLVTSLSRVPLGEGRSSGAMAAWIDHDLRPVVSANGDLEEALARALAGKGTSPPETMPAVNWEGQTYRFDVREAEEQRLRRVREKQGTSPIDVALNLAAVARKLAVGATLDAVSTSAATLKSVALDAQRFGAAGFRQVRDIATRASDDLARIKTPAELHRASQVVDPLTDLGDEALADSLAEWAYAVAISDADSPALLTPHLVDRHDFGIGQWGHSARSRLEWALPKPEIAPGVPWHVSGSLLGLEVALSPLSLRRVGGDRAIDPPTLSTNEREAFAQDVALLNPLTLHDRERDAIAEAVENGRRRVALLAADAGAAAQIADEVRMDGWRTRALRWTAVHEPERVESMFSMTELLRLGRAPIDTLHAWGMPAIATAGCLCTRLVAPNEWRLLVGRPQIGYMAATVADLNLHVAITLRELGLPGGLSRAVLTAAVQDYIDEVRPTDANDWLTLVRTAQAVPRERIEDYVAAAAADGPLVPASSETPR